MAAIVRKIVALSTEDKEKLLLGILVASGMMESFAVDFKFGSFSTIASVGDADVEFFVEFIWKKLLESEDTFIEPLRSCARSLVQSDVQLYFTAESVPHVLSIFHLVAQSLQNEFVFLSISTLT